MIVRGDKDLIMEAEQVQVGNQTPSSKETQMGNVNSCKWGRGKVKIK